MKTCSHLWPITNIMFNSKHKFFRTIHFFMFVKWKYKTALRHKNVVSCKCKGRGANLFTDFPHLLCLLEFIGVLLHLLQSHVVSQPHQESQTLINSFLFSFSLSWQMLYLLGYLRKNSFYYTRYRQETSDAFPCTSPGLCGNFLRSKTTPYVKKKTPFTCQICEVFPKWARYIMLGLSLSCSWSSDCTKKEQIL